MHHAIINDDLGTERVGYALVAETDSEDWDTPLGERADQLVRHACFAGRTRPRRDQDLLRAKSESLLQLDLVIAMDLHGHSHLAEILDEIERERVIIIDDEQHSLRIRRIGREL